MPKFSPNMGAVHVYILAQSLALFCGFFFPPRYSLLIRSPILRFSFIRAGHSPFTVPPDLFSILLAFHCGLGLYHLVLCPLVPSISALLMGGTIRSRRGGRKALSVLSSDMLQSLVVLVWLDLYVLYVSYYFSYWVSSIPLPKSSKTFQLLIVPGCFTIPY